MVAGREEGVSSVEGGKGGEQEEKSSSQQRREGSNKEHALPGVAGPASIEGWEAGRFSCSILAERCIPARVEEAVDCLGSWDRTGRGRVQPFRWGPFSKPVAK